MSAVEIVTVSRKGQIVLPKGVRTGLRISQGTKLLLIEKRGRIMLAKARSLLKEEFDEEESFPMLASEASLAKDWLSKEEDKAWKNL